MVPNLEEDVIIIAAFRRDDLVRLHTLLACYESPFRTTGELLAWEEDLDTHDRLCRQVHTLLDESRR